ALQLGQDSVVIDIERMGFSNHVHHLFRSNNHRTLPRSKKAEQKNYLAAAYRHQRIAEPPKRARSAGDTLRARPRMQQLLRALRSATTDRAAQARAHCGKSAPRQSEKAAFPLGKPFLLH
ncbi:MAG TPA: hypothetical protein VGE47_18260, partial [Burkholderiaceae bacterium]